MICISIAQESRRMALVDMLNAAGQCDLLEIRLDRFDKAPDISELLARKPKPIIFSCRRQQDGGAWQGSEAERLALLRQCIVSKADYVEIELDSADEIRKFPPAKRVITYTNLKETPSNIAEIYERAQTKNPDVIKLATVARAPEEAWPLLHILSKPAVPTVAFGLGKPGVMLSVLGKKIGAPWTYAALEKGMEAYPGQPTVRELEEIYHYREIDRSTKLIGVTGFGEREYVTVGIMNALLATQALPIRCLPLAMGNISLFHKMLEAVHLQAVIVDEDHRGPVLSIATSLDDPAQQSQAVDLLRRKEKKWRGYNLLGKASQSALEAAMRGKSAAEEPLRGRVVMIVGVNATARMLAFEIKERGGMIVLASHDRAAAQQLAQTLECRHVQFEALYSTMHDVLIVCDREVDQQRGKAQAGAAGLHAGYLRHGMTVMDLTASIRKSRLLRDAEVRGCNVVLPRVVLREQLAVQFRKITGQDPSFELLDERLNALLGDEE
ncbi:MAG TPA: type I 3-dehydroquinate dehydratase [Gemmataceae bacterium]|nr:type I 3-dehydroquinate dehydratase [Gemmataceae bacterium]